MNRITPLLIAIGSTSIAFSHPGGLDANGGHNDRKNGGYHYHRTPPATTTAPSAQKAPARAEVPQVASETAATPATKAANAAPATSSPATSDLSKIAIGMTKAQVEAAIGKPNISSATTWHYSSHGWVRFRGDTVFNIEAK